MERVLKVKARAMKAELARVREKVRQRKIERRLVLGPWFKPVPKKAFLQPVALEAGDIARLQKIRANHPGWTDNAIARLGNVERKSTRGKKGIAFPLSETSYFTRLAKVGGKKQVTRALRQAPERFEKAPYTLGVNAIVELVGKGGKPTHILLIKRPKGVEAPGTIDFVAGLLAAGRTPVELLKTRIMKEAGIPKSRLKAIGPGFKETKKGEALALNLNEKRLNYDTVYVIRAGISPEELRQRLRQASDRFRPKNFEIIERSPKAIRKFIGKNTGKILMPEVLRLYSRELYLEGKKKK